MAVWVPEGNKEGSLAVAVWVPEGNKEGSRGVALTRHPRSAGKRAMHPGGRARGVETRMSAGRRPRCVAREPIRASIARTQQGQRWKIGAQVAAVHGGKAVRSNTGMSGNEKIREDLLAWPAFPAVPQKNLSSEIGALGGKRIVDQPEGFKLGLCLLGTRWCTKPPIPPAGGGCTAGPRNPRPFS